MRPQGLRGGITQRENGFDKFGEKLRSRLLGIDAGDRFAALDGFVQFQPFRDELRRNVPEKLAMIAGPARNEKGGAFRHELVKVAVAGQQSQPNQGVADGGDAAQGNLGLFRQLGRGLGGSVKQIKQPVFHRGFEDERRRVAPAHLHQPFRGRFQLRISTHKSKNQRR